MYKDPTDFRKRFLAYKNGKMPYKNGRPTEDEEFESFRQTLPDNQKQLGDYRTRRYWELNDKPKTFGEAIGRGMYNLGDSHQYGQYNIEIPAWHANSVAYDKSSGNYEFMKPNSHPTRWMEDVYGYWDPGMQDFRENYKLQKGPVYDKYVPKKNVYKLHKFGDGKGDRVIWTQANLFRRPDGTYFYQESPDAEEITVTPINFLGDDPAYWTYKDESGKLYQPHQLPVVDQGTITQGGEFSTLDKLMLSSSKNYNNPIFGAPSRWSASWLNNTNPIKALLHSPLSLINTYTLAAATVDNLTSDEGIPKTIRLYNTSDGSDNAKWLWLRSLAGDLFESTMLTPALLKGYLTTKPFINDAAVAWNLRNPKIPKGFNTSYADYDFYHGGLDPDFDFNTLDVFRLGSKQAKRGRNYAGFYMSDNPTKLNAFGYGGGKAHGIKLTNNARMLRLNDNIERIPVEELHKYRDLGYDLLTGYNVWKEPEYVLLNKDAIERTKYFTQAPTNEILLGKSPRDIFDIVGLGNIRWQIQR